MVTEAERKAYRVFSSDAFDGLNGIDRINDTEIKFIYWFLTTQWQRGNRFVIELESVLYTCPSCQRHLTALVEFAQQEGKTIQLKFIAHPNAGNMWYVENKLKK